MLQLAEMPNDEVPNDDDEVPNDGDDTYPDRFTRQLSLF